MQTIFLVITWMGIFSWKGSVTGSVQYFYIVGHLVFLYGQQQVIVYILGHLGYLFGQEQTIFYNWEHV